MRHELSVAPVSVSELGQPAHESGKEEQRALAYAKQRYSGATRAPL